MQQGNCRACLEATKLAQRDGNELRSVSRLTSAADSFERDGRGARTQLALASTDALLIVLL